MVDQHIKDFIDHQEHLNDEAYEKHASSEEILFEMEQESRHKKWNFNSGLTERQKEIQDQFDRWWWNIVAPIGTRVNTKYGTHVKVQNANFDEEEQ